MNREQSVFQKKPSQYSIILMIVAAIFFPLCLLLANYLDGASFVAIIALGFVGVLVYVLFPEITEITFGSNSIKLKERINEAEAITKQLISLRDITIKHTLNSIRSFNGEVSDTYHQLMNFSSLYNMIIKNEDFRMDYKEELIVSAVIIQGKCMKHFEFDVDKDGVTIQDAVRMYLKDGEAAIGNKIFDVYETKSRYFASCYILLDDIIVSMHENKYCKLDFPYSKEMLSIVM